MMTNRSQLRMGVALLVAASAFAACGEADRGEVGKSSDGPLVLADHAVTASNTVLVGTDLGAAEPEDKETEGRAVLALEAIAAASPQTFVSAGVGTSPEGRATGEYWINFTTEPPEGVVNDLADERFRTRISWGLPANEHLLSIMQRALIEALDGEPGVEALRVGAVQGAGESGLTVGLATDGDRDAILEEALEVANKSASADEAGAVEIGVVLEEEEPTPGEFE